MGWLGYFIMSKFYISVGLLCQATLFQVAPGYFFTWIWDLQATEGLSWWDLEQIEQRVLSYLFLSITAVSIASIIVLPSVENMGSENFLNYSFWRRLLVLINVVFIIRLLIAYLFRFSTLG